MTQAHGYGEAYVALRKAQRFGDLSAYGYLCMAKCIMQLGRVLDGLRIIRQLLIDEALSQCGALFALRMITIATHHDDYREPAAKLGARIAVTMSERFPECAEFRFAIGYYTWMLGIDPRIALYWIAKAVEMEPDAHEWRLFLGHFLWGMDKRDEALREYDAIPLAEQCDKQALRRMRRMHRVVGELAVARRCGARLREIRAEERGDRQMTLDFTET